MRENEASPLSSESDDWEEPADAALRKELGFRPTAYADTQQEHPDPAPCPSWCWINTDNPDGYAHEVDRTHPMVATHSLEPSPSIVASLYRGGSFGGQRVQTATIETRVDQCGSRAPVVKLYRRYYVHDEHGQRMKFEERLRLTIADARELIAAITYACDTVEGRPTKP